MERKVLGLLAIPRLALERGGFGIRVCKRLKGWKHSVSKVIAANETGDTKLGSFQMRGNVFRSKRFEQIRISAWFEKKTQLCSHHGYLLAG